MAGVAVVELAAVAGRGWRRTTVTNSISGLSRDTSAFAATMMRADVGVRRAQHRALVERLAHRHEDRRRQALAGDVADQQEQPALVEQEEVVQVAADLARRRHRGVQIDARRRRAAGPARGSVPVWMRCAASELAGDARAVLALRLHDAFERLALPCRLGQRQHQQHAEQQQQAERPASPRRTAGARGGTGRRRASTEQARRRRAAAAPRCTARQRGIAQTSNAPSTSNSSASASAPTRALQQRAVEQVLDQLGVNLAARTCARRSACPGDRAGRRRSGRSAPAARAAVPDRPCPRARRPPRRSGRRGAARSRPAPRRRSRSECASSPTVKLRTAAPAAPGAATGARSATRSISTASVGTSVPSSWPRAACAG